MIDKKSQIRELISTVEIMRQAQKEYFRKRDSASLELSKKLESRVDKMIFDLRNPQEKLFKL